MGLGENANFRTTSMRRRCLLSAPMGSSNQFEQCQTLSTQRMSQLKAKICFLVMLMLPIQLAPLLPGFNLYGLYRGPEQSTVITDNQPRQAIFYNVFINPKEPDNGIRIINEQTLQVLQQWSTHHNENPLPPLFYNLIGLNYTDPFCPPNMTCTLIKHYEQAFEEVTLQSLFDYCRNRPHDIVYYMHNKGSFTKTPGNEKWRRDETDFLFSNVSKALMTDHHDGSCNVVGREWEPFPWWHFHGNFWQAKCSYVGKLIPPIKFMDVRTEFLRRFLLDPANNSPESPLLCLASFMKERNVTNDIAEFSWKSRIELALGRFAYEHWISSHPDVVPCDHKDSVFATHVLNFQTSWIKQEWGAGDKRHQYEWYRLHGRLFEMHHLYGKVPPNTSFFWKYYKGTEVPMEPSLCAHGGGRNISAYFSR